jgi:hypothetical protein
MRPIAQRTPSHRRFVDDIRERIRSPGHIHETEIFNETRSAYLTSKRGRSGQLAMSAVAVHEKLDALALDSVATMQATRHTGDWKQTGRELLRAARRRREVPL